MPNKKSIPDQRELLYQLMVSEERYRNLMNAATDAIYISDGKGMILDINNAACQALGYTRKEIINSHVWEIEIAISPETIKQNTVKLASGPINLEGCHRRKDGTVFPVDVRLSIYHSMGEELVLAIVRDISEQKSTESTIKKLTSALEQIPVSVVITDDAGTIEYVNKKFIEQSGYYYHEIIGQNSRVLKSGKTPTETYQSMWKQLINGEIWQGELHNKHKSGEDYQVLGIISPLRIENNQQTTHYLAIMDNVSKKKGTNKHL